MDARRSDCSPLLAPRPVDSLSGVPIICPGRRHGLFYWDPLLVGDQGCADSRDGVDIGRRAPGRVMGIASGAAGLAMRHVAAPAAGGPAPLSVLDPLMRP